ncbi:MAG: hypothetical protein WCP82_02055 [Alphaproteobacteria bacterium]
MANARVGRVSLATCGIVGALIFSLSGSAMAQVQARPQLSVPLPDGRMILIGGSPNMALFLALDEVHRQGRSVEATVLTFYDPAVSANGKMVGATAADVRFDCDAKTATELGLSGYDAKDSEVLTTPARRPTPISASDYYDVGAGLCGGLAQLPGYVVPTRAAAAKMGRDVREQALRQQAATPH